MQLSSSQKPQQSLDASRMIHMAHQDPNNITSQEREAQLVPDPSTPTKARQGQEEASQYKEMEGGTMAAPPPPPSLSPQQSPQPIIIGDLEVDEYSATTSSISSLLQSPRQPNAGNFSVAKSSGDGDCCDHPALAVLPEHLYPSPTNSPPPQEPVQLIAPAASYRPPFRHHQELQASPQHGTGYYHPPQLVKPYQRQQHPMAYGFMPPQQFGHQFRGAQQWGREHGYGVQQQWQHNRGAQFGQAAAQRSPPFPQFGQAAAQGSPTFPQFGQAAAQGSPTFPQFGQAAAQGSPPFPQVRGPPPFPQVQGPPPFPQVQGPPPFPQYGGHHPYMVSRPWQWQEFPPLGTTPPQPPPAPHYGPQQQPYQGRGQGGQLQPGGGSGQI